MAAVISLFACGPALCVVWWSRGGLSRRRERRRDDLLSALQHKNRENEGLQNGVALRLGKTSTRGIRTSSEPFRQVRGPFKNRAPAYCFRREVARRFVAAADGLLQPWHRCSTPLSRQKTHTSQGTRNHQGKVPSPRPRCAARAASTTAPRRRARTRATSAQARRESPERERCRAKSAKASAWASAASGPRRSRSRAAAGRASRRTRSWTAARRASAKN